MSDAMLTADELECLRWAEEKADSLIESAFFLEGLKLAKLAAAFRRLIDAGALDSHAAVTVMQEHGIRVSKDRVAGTWFADLREEPSLQVESSSVVNAVRDWCSKNKHGVPWPGATNSNEEKCNA